MKRPAISERMKIDALLDRADYFGSPICCAWCGNPLLAQSPLQWDHSSPLALGGAHSFKNLNPLHLQCHIQKTRGTKATTAGSDIHKIAKVKRILRKRSGVKKPGRAWPSKEIPSRPFRRAP